MMDFSNRTALVIDQGLYVHVAEKLAESFGRVLYYCNGWRSAFPVSERFNIGGEQEYLRRQGKRVWGSGHAEMLELHRDELKTLMKSAGLPVGTYKIIT